MAKIGSCEENIDFVRSFVANVEELVEKIDKCQLSPKKVAKERNSLLRNVKKVNNAMSSEIMNNGSKSNHIFDEVKRAKEKLFEITIC